MKDLLYWDVTMLQVVWVAAVLVLALRTVKVLKYWMALCFQGTLTVTGSVVFSYCAEVCVV
jgi:hypothetical protein